MISPTHSTLPSVYTEEGGIFLNVFCSRKRPRQLAADLA